MIRVVANLALLAALGTLPAWAQQGGESKGQPAPSSREAKIAELVKKLGDPQFETREAAQKELEAIGAPATRALEEASRSPDPEIASRATEALSRIREGRGRGAEGRPQEEQEPPLRDPRLPPVAPDMREMMRELEQQMKELERTLPPEFNEMFKDLFRGRLPGQGEQGEQPDEEPLRPGQPRVRVWTWNNGQMQERPRGTPAEQSLGVETGPATPPLRAQLGIPGDEGLVVNQVAEGGRAARAGIQRYDVIVGVDGKSVRSVRDLQPLLRAGAKVDLYRRAQLQTLQVPAPAADGAAPPPAPRQGGSGERSF